MVRVQNSCAGHGFVLSEHGVEYCVETNALFVEPRRLFAGSRYEKTPVDEALLHGHGDLLLPVINAAMVARATSAMSVGEGGEGEEGEEEMEEDEEIEEIIMEAQK